jgi:hypothetical protein
MAFIAPPETAALVGRILDMESSADGSLRLLGDMRRSAGPTTSDDELLRLLVAVQRGFDERRKYVV